MTTENTNDPFVLLTLDQIRKVRDEALNRREDERFDMWGYTFVMPGALYRSNTRLNDRKIMIFFLETIITSAMLVTCNSSLQFVAAPATRQTGLLSAIPALLLHTGAVTFLRGATVKRLDLTGKKFGRLTVKSLKCVNERSRTVWNCLCECGKETQADSGNLSQGNIRSCGCLAIEVTKARFTTHGCSGGKAKPPTREYSSWRGMLKRCNNPKHEAYKNYGGRGISVCERWNSFENFLKDMGERPDGYFLDRIDNDGGYSPENCRWVSIAESGRNKRCCIYVDFKGKRMLLMQFCKEQGVAYQTIYDRIFTNGWPVEKALSTPIMVEYRSGISRTNDKHP